MFPPQTAIFARYAPPSLTRTNCHVSVALPRCLNHSRTAAPQHNPTPRSTARQTCCRDREGFSVPGNGKSFAIIGPRPRGGHVPPSLEAESRWQPEPRSTGPDYATHLTAKPLHPNGTRHPLAAREIELALAGRQPAHLSSVGLSFAARQRVRRARLRRQVQQPVRREHRGERRR
jgi:hypothetical protein